MFPALPCAGACRLSITFRAAPAGVELRFDQFPAPRTTPGHTGERPLVPYRADEFSRNIHLGILNHPQLNPTLLRWDLTDATGEELILDHARDVMLIEHAFQEAHYGAVWRCEYTLHGLVTGSGPAKVC